MVLKPQHAPKSPGDLLHLPIIRSHLPSLGFRRSWMEPDIFNKDPGHSKTCMATTLWNYPVKGNYISTPGLKLLIDGSGCDNLSKVDREIQCTAIQQKHRTAPTGSSQPFPNPYQVHGSIT